MTGICRARKNLREYVVAGKCRSIKNFYRKYFTKYILFFRLMLRNIFILSRRATHRTSEPETCCTTVVVPNIPAGPSDRSSDKDLMLCKVSDDVENVEKWRFIAAPDWFYDRFWVRGTMGRTSRKYKKYYSILM